MISLSKLQTSLPFSQFFKKLQILAYFHPIVPMGGNSELPGSPPGDGGGVSSDESTTAGSILASKNNKDMVLSAEVSSPFPVVDDDRKLELGLGLSVGGGGQIPDLKNSNLADFSSSSNVVGWPPIRRSHRLANQTKSLGQQASSAPEPNRALKNDKYFDTKEVVVTNGYLPVKVNMDGMLIGRKVDLNAHDSYETLSQALEDMFVEKSSSTEAAEPLKLLDATSEFVLTYEDKDGDYMLLGDVPWPMFLSSVKRIRIMRNSECDRLVKRKRAIAAPTCQEKKTRRGTDGI